MGNEREAMEKKKNVFTREVSGSPGWGEEGTFLTRGGGERNRGGEACRKGFHANGARVKGIFWASYEHPVSGMGKGVGGGRSIIGRGGAGKRGDDQGP